MLLKLIIFLRSVIPARLGKRCDYMTSVHGNTTSFWPISQRAGSFGPQMSNYFKKDVFGAYLVPHSYASTLKQQLRKDCFLRIKSLSSWGGVNFEIEIFDTGR